MIECPLIRFDNKQWLESLQDGQMFMRSYLYYQQYESDDALRCDSYDGSIPFPDVNGCIKAISGIDTTNQRLVVFDRYIKCFFHCEPKDFSLYESGWLKLNFSEKTKEVIEGFGVDSALLIFSPSDFIQQIQNACNQRGESCWGDDVKYLRDQEYPEIIRGLFKNPRMKYKIPFYKGNSYSSQQEYRICVQHHYKGIDTDSDFQTISRDTAAQSYTLEIGRIEESCIISVDNLLKNGVLLNPQKGYFYVCVDD